MNTVILKLVCAIAIAGEVLRAGSLVEVTRTEAKDLLRRGKAVVHDHDPETDGEVFSSGNTDPDLNPELASYNADQDAARAAREAEEAAATATGTEGAADAADAAQDAAQDATADAGTSDQAATTESAQDTAQAPAGNTRRRR